MSASAERRLLLVTGAGASVHFGTDDRPLPLMNGWSDALVDALNDREATLASTIKLQKGLSGEDFEEALGAFLRWTQTFDATQRFIHVGRQRADIGASGEVSTWLTIARQRSRTIVQAINSSLWDEFGLGRVDDTKATNTYRQLFEALDAPPGGSTRLFSATTNYDRSGEAVLSEVGFTADTGARGRPGRTQRLDVDQIDVWGDPSTVPHLHLHGAVGWYRDQGGGIRVQPADDEYDDRRTPAVLYPDPDKDPLGETEVGVHLLWRKFNNALESASHVLVLGHSLHDSALVNALAGCLTQQTRLAFCFHQDAKRVQKALKRHGVFRTHQGDVSFIPMDFQPGYDFAGVKEWIEGSHIRIDGTARR